MRLNLGSGNKKFKKFTNVDIDPNTNPDIVADISKEIPVENNSVDEIITQHTLEHVDDLITTLNEIWRVCKNGAKITIEVPHRDSPMAWADPTHKRVFNEETFNYFCINGSNYQEGYIPGYHGKFRLLSQEYINGKYKNLRVIMEAVK